MLKDIELIERVQRCATKFILSDYKSRLIQSRDPTWYAILMHIYEIADILFFIKSLRNPKDKFNILNYFNFTTRPSGTKLYHKTAHINAFLTFYYFGLPRLWNSLPIIDLSLSLAVANQAKIEEILMDSFL